MITRREVLGWCGGLPFIPGSIVAPAAVSAVWYDERAASFARIASGMPGLRMRPLPTDLLAIYDELTRYPARALAGITDPRLLFAIEGLAAHVGFRLSFLGYHVNSSGRGAQHSIIGPCRVTRAFHRYSRSTDWQLALLDALIQVRVSTAPVRTLHLQREAVLRPESGSLFSWVFLPPLEGLA
jgi:hypothetical protein